MAEFEGLSTDTPGAHPKQASALRQDEYVMLKERPCKIVGLTTSSPGKHGGTKVTIVGVDAFTGQEYQDVVPITENCEVPLVKDYAVTYIDNGFLILVEHDSENFPKEKVLEIPEGDLGDKIVAHYLDGDPPLVTVLSAGREEKVLDIKADRNLGHLHADLRHT
ncbi:eukaryotic translation initiation factor 5A-1-like [Branchiostoma floridae x Branchiostoma japonicum]